jgi:hypothetical protein
VYGGQRRQVVLDGRRAFIDAPTRIVLLNPPDEHSGQTTARRRLHAVDREVEQQSNRRWHCPHCLLDQDIGRGHVEAVLPVTGPPPHVLVLRVVGIGQHMEKLGVTRGAAHVLRRAGALTVDDAGLIAPRTDHFDLVLPAVAEVVQVGEAGGQRP